MAELACVLQVRKKKKTFKEPEWVNTKVNLTAIYDEKSSSVSISFDKTTILIDLQDLRELVNRF